MPLYFRLQISCMKKIQILYVSSGKEGDFERIRQTLERENYEVLFRRMDEEIEKVVEKEHPQLLLIDAENDSGSLELCFNLREKPLLNGVSIVILSFNSDIYLQIAAYNSGADDFIQKPVNYRVLLHKIKSLLRRSFVFAQQEDPGVSFAGDLKIDRSRYLIIGKNGEEIGMPRKEFELLSLLMSNPKKVFIRSEILSKIWNARNGQKNRTIDVHIRRLRKKLGNKYIKTVKGIGYCFQP